MHILKLAKCTVEKNTVYKIVRDNDFLYRLAWFFLNELYGINQKHWNDFFYGLSDDGWAEYCYVDSLSFERIKGVVYISHDCYSGKKFGETIKIRSENLLELKLAWDKFLLEEPDEIRLTYKEGRFEFLGRGFPVKNSV